MAILEIKNFDKVKGPLGQDWHYGDMIIEIARDVPNDGIDMVVMHRRLKIIDAVLDKEIGRVELEEPELLELKKLVSKFKWPAVHKEFKEFSDYITSL